MDYSTVLRKLNDGTYDATGDAAAAFAADVRLIVSNAVAYSPAVDNECHVAAKANLVAFEGLFVKEGLATDGGAAAAAAVDAAKPPPASVHAVRERGGRQGAHAQPRPGCEGANFLRRHHPVAAAVSRHHGGHRDIRLLLQLQSQR